MLFRLLIATRAPPVLVVKLQDRLLLFIALHYLLNSPFSHFRDRLIDSLQRKGPAGTDLDAYRLDACLKSLDAHVALLGSLPLAVHRDQAERTGEKTGAAADAPVF